MNIPKLSIIIPVYNTAPYLYRCLNSIINQTLKEIEIICINDNSTDNSLEILKEYKGKDERIEVINFNNNQGVSVARNAGIHMAKSEYVGFVDSDDWIDLDFCEILYNLIKGKNADIAKGSIRTIDVHGISESMSGHFNKMINENKYNFHYWFFTAIYNKGMILTSNIKFAPHLKIGEDIAFLIQAVVNSNRIVTTDNVFYNYARRENSAYSTILSMEKIQSVISVKTFIINYINDLSFNSEDYMVIFSNHFNSLIYLPKRASIENQHYACRSIAACLVDLFIKCKYKDEFIASNKCCFSKYLITNDLDGLVGYLKKNRRERIFDGLREKISQNSYKKSLDTEAHHIGCNENNIKLSKIY